MAQSKHTPGPWRMAPGYEQRGKWSGHLCIHKPNGGTIAMLPKGPHPDINEANARLIAAAPELLAEAIELLRNAEYADGVATVLTQDCEALKAAIAKAEGGAR